jgi:hypothetical protein
MWQFIYQLPPALAGGIVYNIQKAKAVRQFICQLFPALAGGIVYYIHNL